MEYLAISVVAFLVSGLTFFSGFGLGSLLMPVFAIFFPIPVAVAATAVVHLLNNLFKLVLVGGKADRDAILRFALPAAVASFAGAYLLTFFAEAPVVVAYEIGSRTCRVTWVSLVIGVLIVVFSLFELLPAVRDLSFDRRYLPLGGILSGFFGGISGHQGALRAAFLIKLGLSKDAFIGTGVVAAVIVDLARLLVYGASFHTAHFGALPEGIGGLVAAACITAFAGAYFGRRLLHKVTYHAVQVLVGILLVLIGIGLAAGIF